MTRARYDDTARRVAGALAAVDPAGIGRAVPDLGDEYDSEGREVARRLLAPGTPAAPTVGEIAGVVGDVLEEAFGERPDGALLKRTALVIQGGEPPRGHAVGG